MPATSDRLAGQRPSVTIMIHGNPVARAVSTVRIMVGNENMVLRSSSLHVPKTYYVPAAAAQTMPTV